MKPRQIALVVAIAISLVLVPASAARSEQKAAAPQVRASMLVTTDWLARNLSAADLSVIHVAAERKDFDEAHIPGARFLSWDDLTAARDGVPNELPPIEHLEALFTRLGVGNRGRIVLYGDRKGLSAARAWFTLDYLGQGDRAALLDGGLEKWTAERRPVATEAATVAAKPFDPRVVPDVVVGRDVVRDVSWLSRRSGAVALIDARPPAEYSGEKPGEAISRPGHIPGAKNIFWERHFAAEGPPVLRPSGELLAMFRAEGAVPGALVVTYCRTGGQASHSYFVAKYLGLDPKMYDGSFIDWQAADDTEVAKPPAS
jgi:thiosulfate/3-mercaptopyruvate sulfurtransferase